MHTWLRVLHHDLVKRLLWNARDCQELGQTPAPFELCAELFDDLGRPTDARTLWLSLKRQAPSGATLADFERALEAALTAAERGDVATVLCLDAAFERLKESLEPPSQALASTLKDGER